MYAEVRKFFNMPVGESEQVKLIKFPLNFLGGYNFSLNYTSYFLNTTNKTFLLVLKNVYSGLANCWNVT